MVFVKCSVCAAKLDFWTAKDGGWHMNEARVWFCADHHPDDLAFPDVVGGHRYRGFPYTKEMSEQAAKKRVYAEGATPPGTEGDWFAMETRKPPLDPNAGFIEPEDGSEERYLRRRQARPWTAHTFWWIVHNAVAHPLIAFLPFRPLFQFHDWTSRRMHGK